MYVYIGNREDTELHQAAYTYINPYISGKPHIFIYADLYITKFSFIMFTY